jgi:septal ring factor EnvC (AmiA/AmiB activator)
MLNESLGESGNGDVCVSTIQQLNRDKADLSQELSAVRNEREKASEEIAFLQQHRAHLEEQISGFSALADEHERERDELREQTVMVYEKIQYRDRQFVLDRYVTSLFSKNSMFQHFIRPSDRQSYFFIVTAPVHTASKSSSSYQPKYPLRNHSFSSLVL